MREKLMKPVVEKARILFAAKRVKVSRMMSNTQLLWQPVKRAADILSTYTCENE